MSTNFQESDEDCDRFEAYQDSMSKLPLVSYDGYKPHLKSIRRKERELLCLAGNNSCWGGFWIVEQVVIKISTN